MPRSSPGPARLQPARRAVSAVAALVVALAVALAPPAVPAVGQQDPVEVHSPLPAPHAVVAAGAQLVGAVVEGGAGQVWLDGTPLPAEDTGDALGRTLARADLTAGRHALEVRVDGEVVRRWTVLATDLPVTTVPADPLALARAASGGGEGSRPVLLVNPDRPALAAAAGPLGVATGAVVVPTAVDRLPDRAAAAIQETAGEVLLLGGLDAISAAVAQAVADLGVEVTRVGSGPPPAVAAAAAARAPFADVYRRQGGPSLRPVLLAPAEQAVTAAAEAARRGASLLLVDGAALDEATRQVLGTRDRVWLAPGLPEEAAEAARAAAGPEAIVGPLPPAPPADTVWVADADTAVLAARAARPDVAVVTDVEDALAADAARLVAVGEATAAALRARHVDGPAAPAVTATLAEHGGPVVRLQAPAAPQGWSVHVTVHGREWPGRTTVEGPTVTWQAGLRPALPASLEPSGPAAAPLVVTAVVAVDGVERHLRLDRTVTIGPRATTSPEGYLVAGGTGAVVGTGGPVRTYTVEVEPATGLDLDAVTAEVTAILSDPRGWTARGERRLQRVGDPAGADIRVVVATPATVDANCATVGLDTGGRLSCWDGRRANLNLDRWQTGVAPFHTDLEVYRQYLVSHEVGHGLGYGHVGCPAQGALAPVMMQQSKGLGGCVANGWPYPTG